MSHIIIDRRKNDKGKSSINRQKFIRRVRDVLKDSVRESVRNGSIKDLAGKSGKQVTVPVRDLGEPTFHHDGSGVNHRVLPGNDKFVPGDKIKRPPQGGPGPGGPSADDEGEDSFTFHLTKDEFLDIFFENCELPDLVKENMAVLTEEVIQRSGFTSEGSPAQLNIMRSMRSARSRRSGLTALKNKKIKELEARVNQLTVIGDDRLTNEERQELIDILAEIEVLKRRKQAIPFIDPIDLRYNNWSRVDVPNTQAVMVCLMDVSGSMDERKKELAKTFYLLLYLFLERQYDNITIEYVTYHSRAAVVDEEEFFYGRETGGTVTSVGLEKVHDLILEKYNPSLWNIYLAHCSDGDNWSDDNAVVVDILQNRLLPLLQYYAYVEINTPSSWMVSAGTSLWPVLEKLSSTHKNVNIAHVESEAEIYPVFVKLFERKM